MVEQIISDLKKRSNITEAIKFARYFKTGKGEYGEGDVFWGISVPLLRGIAKKYFKKIDISEIRILLKHRAHEVRLTSLILLVNKFQNGNLAEKKDVFNLYLDNTININNWDLVDLSAPKIVGEYLYLIKETKILFKLIKSEKLWERRISVLASLTFIKNDELDLTFRLVKLLLHDKHDLIQKACGWMLREAGKRNEKKLEKFLLKHHSKMGRTMLRYSIEKFSLNKRKYYLSLK